MGFQLWRQDDNGGRFLVDCYPNRDLAEAAMAALSRIPHKQFYWIVTAPMETNRTGAEKSGEG